MKMHKSMNRGSSQITAEMLRLLGRRLTANDAAFVYFHDRNLGRRYRDARAAPAIDVRDVAVAEADVAVHVEQPSRRHDPACERDERAVLGLTARARRSLDLAHVG